MNRIFIITGQTATGKTKLALESAKKYNGELINCDSRQIYRYLDIVTGKDYQLLANVKIWLLDIVKPNKHFSSFDFVKLAVPIIKKIISEGKTPVIVGGTYLYLKHLLNGFETENIPPDWQLRNELGKKSLGELQIIYEDLREKALNLSAFLAGRLNDSEKNNPQRLIRKIEILTFRTNRQDFQHPRLKILPQQSKSEKRIILQQKLAIKNLEVKFIGLKFKNKELLRKAIERRVKERLKNGAIQEVKNLLKMGYSQNDPGLKTIGYQQIIKYLKGDLSKEQAVKEWINKETQYAKRQYTFMKKDKNIKWREI